jgi:hypothetical protein
VYYLEEMASGANSESGVVGDEHSIAPIYSEGSAEDIVQHVVDYLYVVGFVTYPWAGHELEASALASCYATLSAVVDKVAFNQNVRRSPFDVGTPSLGIVDAVSSDVSVLDANPIYPVVIGTLNIVVFDIHMARLVKFNGFVRHALSSLSTAGSAVEGISSEEGVVTPLTVKGIAETIIDLILDGHAEKIEI